jgi:hypothetical protein
MNKIIKKFQTSITSKKVSVSVFKLNGSDKHFGSILNKKTGFTYRKNINSLLNYNEFCDVFELLTGDFLPVLTLLKQGYNDNKIDNLMEKLDEEMDNEIDYIIDKKLLAVSE